MNKTFTILLLGFFVSIIAIAQKPLNKPKDLGPKSVIEILYADSLTGEQNQRIFWGRVKFKHRGAILTCNKAISNEASNSIKAYGNVKINQGDTLTITGDTLFYFGNTRLAEIFGKKVVLIDKDNSTVTSKQINYDLNINEAYYPVPGVIEQDSTILKSNKGYYNTELKTFRYFGDVSITQPDMLLKTDSLEYNSITKWAYFNSPTEITSSDGDLKAIKGKYNTQTKLSEFFGRSNVINEDFSIEADSLSFNQITQNGLAVGNVVFKSFKDSLTIYGDNGIKEGLLTKIDGNALLLKKEQQDTLKLLANTFYAYERKKLNEADTTKKVEKLIANGNVKAFRTDFQSISDSLNYSAKDSLISLIGSPIIWTEDSQLEGDSIQIYLKENKLSKVHLIDHTFIISQDSVLNFNQIKGRKTEAYFNELNEIKQVQVSGNGESLYFALDDKNKLIGLNRVQCSKMRLNFSSSKIKEIAFLGNPESKLYPPHEINEELKFLPKFAWKQEKRPKINDFKKKLGSF